MSNNPLHTEDVKAFCGVNLLAVGCGLSRFSWECRHI